MHNPPHPGEVLRGSVLAEISVTEFAQRLGVSRVALSRVINGRAAVSAEMAIRFAAARTVLGDKLKCSAASLTVICTSALCICWSRCGLRSPA